MMRNILLLATLTWTCAGCLTPTQKQRPSEAEVIAAITHLGGSVKRDASMSENPVVIVSLRFSQAGDSLLRQLTVFPKLKTLSLNNCPITDSGIEFLRDLPLESLILDETNVTDEALKTLGKMKTLRWIDLNKTKVAGEGITYVAELSQLHSLFLSNTGIGRVAFDQLAKLETLELLEISGTKCTDEDVAKLHGMKQLRFLLLGNTKISDKGLEAISGFPKLEALSVENTSITASGIAKLQKLKLSSLRLDGIDIGDNGVEVIGSLKSLEILEVRNTKISASGMDKLKEMLPKTKITQ